MDYKNESELQKELAEYLRQVGYMTFTEIEMPSTGYGRIDIVAVKPHAYATPNIRAYEVKLTRSAFLADVNAGKYKRYLDTVHQLYFAAPKGVINKDELPPYCGLIVRGENGWHAVKSARILKASKLCFNDLLALLYRGYENTKEIRRLSDRVVMSENLALEKRVKSLGHQIARRLAGSKAGRLQEWAEVVSAAIIQAIPSITDNDCPEEIDGVVLPSSYKLASKLEAVSFYLQHIDLIHEFSDIMRGWSRGDKDQLEKLLARARDSQKGEADEHTNHH